MEIAASSLSPETFIPTWQENRNLPPEEQISVTVKFPTSEEWEPFKARKVDDLDAIGIIKQFVVEVRNFTVAGNVVRTGEELVQQRRQVVSGLVAEILLYIVLGADLTEGQGKN